MTCEQTTLPPTFTLPPPPQPGKPVMEGKAVLFKKFADLDAFDVEIAEQDPDQLIRIICALEPTFGGINLEDIKVGGWGC